MLRATILIVDPDSVERASKARVLSEAGHKVTQHAGDESLFERIRIDNPQILVIKLGPNLSDLDFIRRIKTDPATASTMIIATFTHGGREAIRAGADILLGEPACAVELLSAALCALKVWQAGQMLKQDESRFGRLIENARANEAQLAAVIGSAMDAIITIDSNQRVTLFNAAAERVFRCPAVDAIGQPIDKFIPPRFQQAHRNYVSRFGDTHATQRSMGNLGSLSGLRTDGEEFPMEASISQVEVHGQRLYTVILRDVTARKQVEEERTQILAREQTARKEAEEAQHRLALLANAERAAKAEAETANRVKDEFLATLSHELRTPINAVLGWARMLRRGKLDESTVVRAIEIIERNAQTQAKLVEDILDISRIITGKFRLDVREVNLSPVIEAAVDTMRPAANAKGIRLETTFETGSCTIVGDPDRLQQLVWNLLSNAVKFTPSGGHILVRLGQTQSRATVTVTDTGEGISPDFLPHVFDRLRQADGTTARSHGGLGLGLALVRHLAEQHGGTVRASSPGRGFGSTFTVEIPLRSQEPELQKIRSAAASDAYPAGGRQVLRGLRVLVVDDEPDSLDMISTWLGKSGAQVIPATSCSQALEAFDRFHPDLLLADIGMPVRDGYALIEEIRNREAGAGSKTPAIALTAYAGIEDSVKAIMAGYQVHVPKPVDLSKLTLLIANMTGRAVRTDKA